MNTGEIFEPILIDGLSYSRGDLLEHCRRMALQSGVPDWKREVFAFLELFLGAGGKEIRQFTSGTTGDPKEVRLTRGAMLLSARRTLALMELKPGDRALLCLPVTYIAGKMMVVRALAGGLNLLLAEPSGRPLQELGAPMDFAAMVPLQVHESLANQDPISRVGKLIVGGGQLHASLRDELAGLSRPLAYETFGMTETCTHFALRKVNGPQPDPFFILLEGVKAVVDPRGCLEVDIPGITSGRITTNDLVRMENQGRGFTWLGRYDHVINTGGIKVIPELVEQQARRCTGLECLVLPEGDQKLGEQVVLLVEYHGENPPVEQWLECLRRSLSTYEVPRRVLPVKELPRNKSLKPDRTSAARLLL
jgi:O-succinylbenzoic acid--CoA ligase